MFGEGRCYAMARVVFGSVGRAAYVRETKVGHLGDGARDVEQNVGALDVAVDDAATVQEGDAARDLAAE